MNTEQVVSEPAYKAASLRFAMKLSLWIGVLMFLTKVGAYFITGSAAILSDAAESVVHVVAVAFAAYSLRVTERPADDCHLYGHAKIGFFSAGFEGALIGLAAIYIIGGVFTPALTPAHGQALARTMFGIICFAALFSFAGTVLGGIWADQSWGRFWGWDPKENGALLIVLWCALVLHAHWGRMIKGRGLAVLSVFGGIVTSWSWFGTNQLGVGLHSYGFMESTAFWLLLFVASQLLLMAIGLVPTARWRSPMQQDRAAAPDTAAARLMPSE